MSGQALAPHASGAASGFSAPSQSGVRFRDNLLFLAILSNFFVIVDPSPHELIVIFGLVFLILANIRLPRFTALLIWLLVLISVSGLIAALPILERPKVSSFVLVSFFLGLATLFYVLILSENTLLRLNLLRRAWVIAGVLAAFLGIIGYFNVAGLGAMFTAYDGTRAKATFNDPNVFGPFLIAPTVFLAQEIILSRKIRLIPVLAVLVLCLGQFLSFSRASWGHLAGSLVIMALLAALTVPSPRFRLRLAYGVILGIILIALSIVFLLSLDSVGKVFAERASLQQSYDVKSGGRFDNYLHALNAILDAPLGLGPFEFARRFGEDVHNAYLNTFVSYGWIGGLSYCALVLMTLHLFVASLRYASAFRPHLIAFGATFLPLAIMGGIIHTDHWRHFYILLAAIWVICAGIAREQRLIGHIPQMGGNKSPLS